MKYYINILIISLFLFTTLHYPNTAHAKEPWENWLPMAKYSTTSKTFYPEFHQISFNTNIQKAIIVPKNSLALVYGDSITVFHPNCVYKGNYAVLGEGSYFVIADAVRIGKDLGNCHFKQKFFPEYWQSVLNDLYPNIEWIPKYIDYPKPNNKKRIVFCTLYPTTLK